MILTIFAPLILPVSAVVCAGGTSGSAVTSTGVSAGWDDFQDPEEIDVAVLINGGYADPIVQNKMNTVALARDDAIAVLDVPSASQQFQAAADYRNATLNLGSNRAALYTPDVLVEDIYNSRTLYAPPSGMVAAVYARTDKMRNPSFSPAGIERGTLPVLGLRYRYQDSGSRSCWAGAYELPTPHYRSL
jgi:hypothetical protein